MSASRPVETGHPTRDRRLSKTLGFMAESLAPPARLLDLGAENPMSRVMREAGYAVVNTDGDLDLNPDVGDGEQVDAVTAFEILEHLVAPFNVLRALPAGRLFASVPLRLWFASAYNNPKDPWDRHFHEFEDWQFDWLLEKAGWRVVRRAHWISPARRFGVRPLLRRFVPRHYIVEAVRDPES